MADEKYWREVLSGQRTGAKYTAIRTGLRGLELLYAAGLAIYLGAEEIGLRPRAQLEVPVISVGNLSVGGTGKTPVTQWIVRRLLEAGFHPVVLNRGHGGSLSTATGLVSNRSGRVILSAAEAGDEAVLLARSLSGAPVVVGKDRRKSGTLAVSELDADVLVLDDGFQYWQLARDVDIVLLDGASPFDNGHALPRGFLREPKSNLARAGIVMVTRAGALAEAERARLRHLVAEYAPTASLFFSRHEGVAVEPVNSAAREWTPSRFLPFCGIGQPASFRHSLKDITNVDLAETVAFSDHQPYGDDERDLLLQKATEAGADALITTEKDAVKLRPDYFAMPLYQLRMEIVIEQAELFWETLVIRAGLADAPNE